MKALFIGGTGVISSAVSKLAAGRGIDLLLLNRGKHESQELEGIKTVIADIRDEDSVKKVLGRQEFDAVVDWVAYTPDQVETDIRLFSGITRQYVFISSASAYRKPESFGLITEATTLDNPHWQYSRDKIACEERLMREYREKGFPVTIVRPSLTYGNTTIPFPISSRSHPWTLADRIMKGRKVVVPGDGTSFFTITHNTDFAAGFIGILGNGNAIGEAFHITSDEAPTWDRAINDIGEAVGVKPDILHIPSDSIIAFDPGMEGTLLGDKSCSALFDNSKIKAFVPGFKAVVPFSEGIRRSVEWYGSRPELKAIDEDFNDKLDALIKKYSCS